MRDSVGSAALVIAVISVCAVIIVQTHTLSEKVIVRRADEQRTRGLTQTLPGFTVGPAKKSAFGDFLYWEGLKKIDEKTTVRGFAFIARWKGPAGHRDVLVGIDEQGAVLGFSAEGSDGTSDWTDPLGGTAGGYFLLSRDIPVSTARDRGGVFLNRYDPSAPALEAMALMMSVNDGFSRLSREPGIPTPGTQGAAR